MKAKGSFIKHTGSEYKANAGTVHGGVKAKGSFIKHTGTDAGTVYVGILWLCEAHLHDMKHNYWHCINDL